MRGIGIRPDAVAQRSGKARGAKDANRGSVRITRHPRRMARTGQRARNDDPVITGRHARYPVTVAFKGVRS